MARVIRKFVDKNFIRTVDLEQLERIIEKYRNSIDYDLAALPKKEQERRQSLYELFRSAGDLFPADLQYALHCICRVASDNGVRLLQARAESGGVVLVPDK